MRTWTCKRKPNKHPLSIKLSTSCILVDCSQDALITWSCMASEQWQLPAVANVGPSILLAILIFPLSLPTHWHLQVYFRTHPRLCALWFNPGHSKPGIFYPCTTPLCGRLLYGVKCAVGPLQSKYWPMFYDHRVYDSYYKARFGSRQGTHFQREAHTGISFSFSDVTDFVRNRSFLEDGAIKRNPKTSACY